MAVAERKLQEELCKSCAYKHSVNESKMYCPFGRCIWDEKSYTLNGKIKTVRLKNRLNGEVKAIAVYSQKVKQANS